MKKLIIVLFLLIFSSFVEAKTAYFNVDDVCLKVDKVDKNKVYMKKQDNCSFDTKVSRSVRIDVEDNIDEIEIFINEKFVEKKRLFSFKKDFYKESPDWKKAEDTANTWYNYYKSDEFQTKLKKENERVKEFLTAWIESRLNENHYKQYEEDNKTEKKENLQRLDKIGNNFQNDRLYIFISSSIPFEVIRNYIREADRIGKYNNIVFVMRGFINGAKYILPTVEYISKLLVKNTACNVVKEKCEFFNANIIVDPLLFSRYGIQEVPTFVYAKNLNITDHGLSEGMDENVSVSNCWKISGDANFTYAINKLIEKADSDFLRYISSKLENNFYRQRRF